VNLYDDNTHNQDVGKFIKKIVAGDRVANDISST